MHPCRAFKDPHNLYGASRTLANLSWIPSNSCGSSWPGTHSYSLALILRSSSEFGDELDSHNHATLEAVIVRVWSYTWRPFWSEFGDALGANHRVSLAICTWRLCECDLHDCDQANIEMHIGGHG
jgi:hypothetical protein